MIKLRLVGSSDDLKNLVLSAKPRGKRGSHMLAVDEKLFRVLEDLVRQRRRKEREDSRPRLPEPRQEPKIPPREIQRLLRAGKRPADVAKEAEVDIAYVEQFHPPILYERDGIIRDALNAVLSKQRLGRSALPLGEAVVENLRVRKVNLTDEEIAGRWSAVRADSQPWTITFTFSYRGTRRAVWRYNPQKRELLAANSVAADIGWVSNGKRARAASRPSIVPKAAAARPATKAARRRRKPAKRKPVKRKPTKRAAAKRKPAKRKPTKRPAAKRPAARRRPAKRRPAARRPAARRPATRRPARRGARRSSR